MGLPGIPRGPYKKINKQSVYVPVTEKLRNNESIREVHQTQLYPATNILEPLLAQPKMPPPLPTTVLKPLTATSQPTSSSRPHKSSSKVGFDNQLSLSFSLITVLIFSHPFSNRNFRCVTLSR